MLVKLAGLFVILTIAILWLIGLLSLYRVVDISFSNRTLGVCWIQLTFPLGLSIYGLACSQPSNLILSGGMLFVSAISNHANPNNGFVGYGGSWYWQVPFLAVLGGLLMLVGLSQASFTKYRLFVDIYFQRWGIVRESPIVLGLFIIYGHAVVLLFFVLLFFVSRFLGSPNAVVPLIIATLVSTALAFGSISPHDELKRMSLISAAVLLMTACWAFWNFFGSSLELGLRLLIVLTFIWSFFLLSPSMLNWMKLIKTSTSNSQVSIADLLYYTFFCAIGAVIFGMLG